jgi:hypothetical protein
MKAEELEKGKVDVSADPNKNNNEVYIDSKRCNQTNPKEKI